MATLQDLRTAVANQTAAIADLALRMPPPGSITPAQADEIATGIGANTAAINAITPPPAPQP